MWHCSWRDVNKLTTDQELKTKIRMSPNSNLVNQQVLLGLFREFGWRVAYSSRNDTKIAASLKSTPAWVTVEESWNPRKHYRTCRQFYRLGKGNGIIYSWRLRWSEYSLSSSVCESSRQKSCFPSLSHSLAGSRMSVSSSYCLGAYYVWSSSGTSWNLWVVYFLYLRRRASLQDGMFHLGCLVS